jgi:hypothetical protein
MPGSDVNLPVNFLTLLTIIVRIFPRPLRCPPPICYNQARQIRKAADHLDKKQLRREILNTRDALHPAERRRKSLDIIKAIIRTDQYVKATT